MSHLSNLFRRRRMERGLRPGQLARLLGYKNITKGANRIQSFENGGKARPDLLGNLAKALEISPEEIQGAIVEDYRNWLAWADEPIRPHVVVRLLAAVYQRVELPDEALDPEAAEAFAARLARERRMRTWLVLSRRASIQFDKAGRRLGRMEATPEMSCEPHAVIGGRRVQFDLGGVGLRLIDDPPS